MPSVQEIDAELKRRKVDAINAEIASRGAGEPAPIPDVVKPKLAIGEDNFVSNALGSTTIGGKTSGLVSRPTFEAAGGTIGAALGAGGGFAGGGPVGAAAGMLAGDALGSAAGSLIFDTVQDAADYMGLVQNAPPGMEDRLQSAYKAGRDAMIYGPVAQIVGASPSIVRAGIGKVLGVTGPVTDELMRAARNASLVTRTASGDVIPAIGAAEAASGTASRFGRLYLKVLGVFPFIGSPFRNAAAQKSKSVTNVGATLLDRLAPNATLQSDIGINMADAAEGTFDEFRRVSGVLYGAFRQEAQQYGDVIPSKSIVNAANDFAGVIARGEVRLVDGGKLPARYEGPLVDYIDKLRNLPENISMEAFDSIVGKLSDLMQSGAREGANIAFGTQIKKAAEASLSEITEPALRDAYGVANNFYSKGILQTMKLSGGTLKPKTRLPESMFEGGKTKFKSPTAKKFIRADKKIFEPGFGEPGSINKDELIKIVKALDSPQAVRDLRALVGDESIGQIARDRVGRAFETSAITNEAGELVSYSADAFRKALGMTGETKLSQETFDELLKTTGVNLSDFHDMLTILDRVEIPKNVSQFIARRGILGGLRSALKSALPLSTAIAGPAVAGAPSAILPAVVGTLMLRYGSKILAAPEMLTALRRSIRPSLSELQKREMLGRVVNYLSSFEDQETAATPAIGP